MLAAGEAVVFCGSGGSEPPDRVRVDFPHFAALVTERSQVVIGDGVPRLAVEGVADGEVVTRVVSPGPLSARKGVNVTYARPELPAITEKDLADLTLAAELDADFVALSFVRTADDLEQLRAHMGALSCQARVVAKIEKVEAYERLDEIIDVSDGIMVARGDYGVEAGVAHVPLMQKDTIARATQAGKLVITATQMLESMIHAPEPTRAEATDVANAVIDGSSAVMLSAETSVGSYPVEAVQAMAEIAEAAEHAPEIHGRARSVRRIRRRRPSCTPPSSSRSELDAVALVVPTATGGAPRACAKYRSKLPIIALAHDRRVADQISLDWGVYCFTMDVAESVDDMIEGALIAARDAAGLPTGARVVLTAGGGPGTPGATNLIMVREIPSDPAMPARGEDGLGGRCAAPPTPRGWRA